MLYRMAELCRGDLVPIRSKANAERGTRCDIDAKVPPRQCLSSPKQSRHGALAG